MKLTKLYPPSIKPVRSGVYRTSAEGLITGFSYFDARKEKWGNTWLTPEAANKFRSVVGAIQEKYWRGLAKEPK